MEKLLNILAFRRRNYVFGRDSILINFQFDALIKVIVQYYVLIRQNSTELPQERCSLNYKAKIESYRINYIQVEYTRRIDLDTAIFTTIVRSEMTADDCLIIRQPDWKPKAIKYRCVSRGEYSPCGSYACSPRSILNVFRLNMLVCVLLKALFTKRKSSDEVLFLFYRNAHFIKSDI